MKTLVIFLFGILFITKDSTAQTVFAPQGAVWHYEFNFDGDGANYRYEAEKDTLYQGVLCSKVIGQRKNKAGITSLPPTYFYNSSDTVFYYHDSLKSFTPLYIFNVKAGDTLILAAPKFLSSIPKTAKFLVTKVDTSIIDGIPLRNVYTKPMDLYYFLPKYTERIGGHSVANIIGIDVGKTAMHYETIRCYRDNEIEEQFLKDKWDCDYVPTNIDEKFNEPNIQIFPNPVVNKLTIKLPENSKTGQVKIIGIDGRVLMQQDYKTSYFEIDISSLSNGIYYLQLGHPNVQFSKVISVIH